jgi:hypothetical protein
MIKAMNAGSHSMLHDGTEALAPETIAKYPYP